MNVFFSQRKLTPAQAGFFASGKPEVGWFDLAKDPHEVKNVLDESAYANVQAELLAELDRWQTEVILDQGVSDAFRAIDVFPEMCPLSVVDDWVAAKEGDYNFGKSGYSSWCPTHTLEEWAVYQTSGNAKSALTLFPSW